MPELIVAGAGVGEKCGPLAPLARQRASKNATYLLPAIHDCRAF